MMTKKALVTGLACSLLLGSALAAPEAVRAYSHQAAVQPAPQEGLQSLALPWPVLQASRSPGLADVRLFNAQGQVLPMAWARELPAREQERRVSVPRFAWPEPASAAPGAGLQLQLDAQGMVLQLQTSDGRQPAVPGAARRWLLDLSALPAEVETLRQIRLDWPHRPAGLSSSVLIETSMDGRAWQALQDQPRAAQRLLQLPASEPTAPSLKTLDWPAGMALPRYLRLQFEQPLALQASELLLLRRQAPADLQQALQFQPEPATQTTAPAAWQLDLQARIAPRALALQLPAGNHLLPLRLEQRDAPEQPWRTVSRFVAWRMQRDGLDASSPTQALPQAPAARYWRLAAEGPAAALQGQALNVQWHWQAPRLVFLAPTQPAQLQLAVGRAKAQAGSLPLASLMPGYREGDEFKLAQAQLGPLSAQPEPGWQEQLLSAPDPETRQRWLLWAVLIAAVAGLGVLAWRLVRQLPDRRQEQDGPAA